MEKSPDFRDIKIGGVGRGRAIAGEALAKGGVFLSSLIHLFFQSRKPTCESDFKRSFLANLSQLSLLLAAETACEGVIDQLDRPLRGIHDSSAIAHRLFGFAIQIPGPIFRTEATPFIGRRSVVGKFTVLEEEDEKCAVGLACSGMLQLTKSGSRRKPLPHRVLDGVHSVIRETTRVFVGLTL